MKEQLCMCTACGTVMIDQNPQVDALAIDTTGIVLVDMVRVTPDWPENEFWGCPDCEDDGNLIDITENNVHLIKK